MTNQIILNNNNAITQLNISLLDSYINYVDAKENTKHDYLKALKPFITWLYNQNIDCEALNRDVIIKYRDYLLKNHKPTTCRNYMHAIKLFCNWLYYTGIKNKMIYHDIKNVEVTKEFKKLDLKEQQINLLLSQFDMNNPTEKTARDYAIICLMLCCGLRCAEVEKANINDLQPYGNGICLWVQGKRHVSKDKFVMVPTSVLQAIYKYLQIRGVDVDQNGNDPLFTSVSNYEKGNRVVKESISRIVKNAMRNVGINSEKYTAHSLRHTACTIALKNGATLEQAQQMMRHENIQTTMIYNHSIERENNPCESIIENVIFNKNKK